MATVRCKNTYGDGRVEYVEYEVAEPTPEDDDEITAEEALEILRGGASYD